MNYRLRSMAWGSILAFCATVLGASPAFAQSAGLAAVYVAGDSIVVEPTVPYELLITISGPDGLRIEEALDPGGPMVYGGGTLPDGHYKYEISILSMSVNLPPFQDAALQLGSDENGRPVGAAAALGAAVSPMTGPTRQSGGFRVLDGWMLDPSAPE